MLLFANGARGGEVLPAKCFSLFSICKPKWDGWRSSANRCSRHRVSPSDKTCQKGAEARRKNSPHLQSKHLKCQGPSSYGGGKFGGGLSCVLAAPAGNAARLCALSEPCSEHLAGNGGSKWSHSTVSPCQSMSSSGQPSLVQYRDVLLCRRWVAQGCSFCCMPLSGVELLRQVVKHMLLY